MAQSDSILLAALAAEILTYQGSPTLPLQLIIKSQQKAGDVAISNGTVKHIAATFGKRISVNDYNFFELVHPAYFRQNVTLATLVARFIKSPSSRAMDVGTGPGTNLLAFQELMPDTEDLAIEPTVVAFQYLQGHSRGYPKFTYLQKELFDRASGTGKDRLHHIHRCVYITSTRTHSFNAARNG